MGNWSYDVLDDFTNPDGQISSITNLNNFEAVHKDFAINWLLDDREDRHKGASLFNIEFGRSSSYYANRTFEPQWKRSPEEILPINRTEDITKSYDLCDESYQCRFDYAMSLNWDMALATKFAHDNYTKIRNTNSRRGKVSIITQKVNFQEISKKS